MNQKSPISKTEGNRIDLPLSLDDFLYLNRGIQREFLINTVLKERYYNPVPTHSLPGNHAKSGLDNVPLHFDS